MARNKHPEETVQRILTTASKLFLEKGYEKTSLQDIIPVSYTHLHPEGPMMQVHCPAGNRAEKSSSCLLYTSRCV